MSSIKITLKKVNLQGFKAKMQSYVTDERVLQATANATEEALKPYLPDFGGGTMLQGTPKVDDGKAVVEYRAETIGGRSNDNPGGYEVDLAHYLNEGIKYGPNYLVKDTKGITGNEFRWVSPKGKSKKPTGELSYAHGEAHWEKEMLGKDSQARKQVAKATHDAIRNAYKEDKG